MAAESLLLFVLGTVGPGLCVAYLVTWLVRPLALRWGLVDQPNHRKVHTTPIPLGGGIGIAAGVCVPFLIGFAWLFLARDAEGWYLPELVRPHVNGILARGGSLAVLLGCALLLMILGLLDDRWGVPWQIRLGLQFGIALVCVVTQGWRLTAFIDLPGLGFALSVGLSVIWIVGLINSFNMLDNMDALSGGVAAIAATLLACVMLLTPETQSQQPQLFVSGFLLVLVGALLGFLCHNRPPAAIFMGDAGSYFVGFCIAVATLLATYVGAQTETPHAILAPLCVMAVPLYDMITVLWIRIRSGKSPFEADKNHFSHRLVDLGLTKPQAVLTIYLTTATCGLGALLLHQVSLFGAGVIAATVVCVLLLIAILESTARRKLKDGGR